MLDGNTLDDKTILMWRRERNAAVSSLDVEQFRKFYQRWMEKGVYEEELPKDNKVVEISICKMACNIPAIPTSRREEARDWLRHNGYSDSLN